MPTGLITSNQGLSRLAPDLLPTVAVETQWRNSGFSRRRLQDLRGLGDGSYAFLKNFHVRGLDSRG